MMAKNWYTRGRPRSGAAMMLTHHRVEPASKAAYVLFFTGARFSDDGLRPDHRLPGQVRPQGFRNHDRAVLLLIVLHDCDPGSSHCQSRAVQSMHKSRLLARAWPILYVGAAGLKSVEIAARRNFAIGVLSGQPHFDV